MSDWPVVTLKDAGVSLIDCDHKTPKAQEEGLPYIGIPQLKEGCINLDSARLITELDFHQWRRKAKPTPNDIILSRRCNPGVTAYVPEGLEIALGQNLVLLRSVGKKLYPPFLRWVVQGPSWWNQIGKFINVGSIFDSLKCVDIPNFEIKLPPIEFQKNIAEGLGALDQKIQFNRQINQTLEQIAQAIFKSWFVDFEPVKAKIEARQNGQDQERAAMRAISGKTDEELNQLSPDQLEQLVATAALFPDTLVESGYGYIPKSWKVKTIDDVTSHIIDHRGKTPKKLGGDWSVSGFAAVSAKNIKNGRIVNLSSIRYVNESLYRRWMKVELEMGDILLTSEAPMGQMYFLAEQTKYLLSQRLYGLRANTESVTAAYLYLWLQTAQAKADMESRVTGTTIVGIRQSELRKIKVLSPNIKLLDKFEDLVIPIYQNMHLNENQTLKLYQLQDTLLPKLLSGDITFYSCEGVSG